RPDARLARLAVPRPPARRRLDLTAGGDARTAPRGGCLCREPARRRAGGRGAALRARRPADRALARDRDATRPSGAADRGRARLARLPAGGRARDRRPHTVHRRGGVGRGGCPGPAARPRRRGVPGTVIEAVVFDLDGVLIQTEELWDEVREGMARDAGGRYGAEEQRAMMGMSSPE